MEALEATGRGQRRGWHGRGREGGPRATERTEGGVGSGSGGLGKQRLEVDWRLWMGGMGRRTAKARVEEPVRGSPPVFAGRACIHAPRLVRRSDAQTDGHPEAVDLHSFFILIRQWLAESFLDGVRRVTAQGTRSPFPAICPFTAAGCILAARGNLLSSRYEWVNDGR
jgi:hypothetical protein